jgi:hypothetical protein
MKFRFNCTFSHLGDVSTIDRPNYIINVSEFVGTEQEHHSGTFEVYLPYSEDKSIVDTLLDYLRDNDLIGECYSVSVGDVLIFTEEDIRG